MKPGSLLIAVFFSSALFCHAQDKANGGQATAQDSAKPATPDAATRPAPDAAKTAVPETAKPAAPDTAKPVKPDATSQATSDSYVIGESDEISISVWKEPDLSTGSGKDVTVRSDGMISMPLLGDVKAAGKTPLELAAEITVKLKKYIQDPNVTVILVAMRSKEVYLIGEVAKPGPFYLAPGMTLLQVIAYAGGLTPYANSKKIYILRNASGKQEKIPVQYKRALKGDGSLNLILYPGDTIVVP